VLAAAWVVGFALVLLGPLSGPLLPPRPAPRLRPAAYNLTDFGGVSSAGLRLRSSGRPWQRPLPNGLPTRLHGRSL